MGTFLLLGTKQGERKTIATKARGASATARKVKAMAQKEAIENKYAMRIDRANEQRNTRRAKRTR